MPRYSPRLYNYCGVIWSRSVGRPQVQIIIVGRADICSLLDSAYWRQIASRNGNYTKHMTAAPIKGGLVSTNKPDVVHKLQQNDNGVWDESIIDARTRPAYWTPDAHMDAATILIWAGLGFCTWGDEKPACRRLAMYKIHDKPPKEETGCKSRSTQCELHDERGCI